MLLITLGLIKILHVLITNYIPEYILMYSEPAILTHIIVIQKLTLQLYFSDQVVLLSIQCPVTA